MQKITIEIDDNLYERIVNRCPETERQEHLDYEDLKNAVEYGMVTDEYNIAIADALKALCGECSRHQNGGKCSKCEQYHAILGLSLREDSDEADG